jgi:hypothetical protein
LIYESNVSSSRLASLARKTTPRPTGSSFLTARTPVQVAVYRCARGG